MAAKSKNIQENNADLQENFRIYIPKNAGRKKRL